MGVINFEHLKDTAGIKVVDAKLFAEMLFSNNTRGYNNNEVNFYDDYISLSAPYNHGVHYTLVTTRSNFENHFDLRKTMEGYYVDLLECYYIPLYNEYLIKETIRNMMSFINQKDLLDKIKEDIKWTKNLK